jgi:hypothetical protein
VIGSRTYSGREAESLCRAGASVEMEAFEQWVYARSASEAAECWLRYQYMRGWNERKMVAWWVEVCFAW